MVVRGSSMYLKGQVLRADEDCVLANVDIYERYPGGHVLFPLTGEVEI